MSEGPPAFLMTTTPFTIEEARELVPSECKDISDKKLLAIMTFFQKIRYAIIEEEFTSK